MKTHTLLQKQANPRPARLLTLLRRSGLAGFSPGLFAKRPSLRAAPVLRPPRRTAHPFPLPRRSASFFGAPCIHFRSRAHPQPLRGDIPRRSAFRTAAPCRSSCARTVSASAAPPVPAAGARYALPRRFPCRSATHGLRIIASRCRCAPGALPGNFFCRARCFSPPQRFGRFFARPFCKKAAAPVPSRAFATHGSASRPFRSSCPRTDSHTACCIPRPAPAGFHDPRLLQSARPSSPQYSRRPEWSRAGAQ